MRTQTYFHTKLESDANRKNDTVPFQVNCVGAVSQEEPFSNRSVRKDYYYIYVLQGKMILKEEVLCPGDVIIFEPGYPYQYESEGNTSYVWVHYTGYEAGAFTRQVFPKVNEKQHIGFQKELAACFQRLYREFMIHDEMEAQLSVCILKEILLLTGRYARTGEKNNLPLAAMEYIHRNFREDMDVDQLARLENRSVTSFRCMFKAHTGMAPNEYIIMQRISAACQLLTQTDKSVGTIASEVGYHDQYYFSRIFKKMVGISPQRYRKGTSDFTGRQASGKKASGRSKWL